MKTTSLLGSAAMICSLLITFSGYADSPFTEKDACNNAAIAASPRAKESFPWLTRTSSESVKPASANRELKNAAYVKSPRVLEANPELTRGDSSPAVSCTHVPELVNRGYAASPRAKEMFPHLRLAGVDAPACVSCVTECKCCG